MIFKNNNYLNDLLFKCVAVTYLIYTLTYLPCALAKEPLIKDKTASTKTVVAPSVKTTKNKQSQLISIPPKPYKPANITKLSKSGQILFAKHNCVICHSVGNHGGCLGPPLMGEGARRSKDFILSRITQGAKAETRFQQFYKASELMPHPRVPEKTAEAITAYILTLGEPKSGFLMSKHHVGMPHNLIASPTQIQKPSQASSAIGKKLFFEKGCAVCHTASGVGGQFAPELDGIATKRERAYVEQIINQAQTLELGSADEYNERGTMMPPLNLTPIEVAKITDFLMTLPPR